MHNDFSYHWSLPQESYLGVNLSICLDRLLPGGCQEGSGAANCRHAALAVAQTAEGQEGGWESWLHFSPLRGHPQLLQAFCAGSGQGVNPYTLVSLDFPTFICKGLEVKAWL